MIHFAGQSSWEHSSVAERALVLGGGGSVGIAWLSGMVRGLQEGGVDVTSADLIAGTSAGSIVGIRLAHGDSPETLLNEQLAVDPAVLAQAAALQSQIDMRSLTEIFQLWGAPAELTEARLAAIGTLALAAKTPPEESIVAFVETALRGRGWPSVAYLATAVDCETGGLEAWGAHSGVPAERAVASSCAVPGLFPPITLAGRRYMDGGVRSGTNANLAAGAGRVLVIAPIGAGTDPLSATARRAAAAECAALQAGGARTLLLFPDAEAQVVFGPNMMALDRSEASARAGLRQGRAAAAGATDLWNG
jgi:NTE family protein